MKKYPIVAVALTLVFLPFAAQASIAYPEGVPNHLAVGQVLGESSSSDMTPERRAELMQTILLLRAQLARLLEQKAIPVPESGENIVFSRGTKVVENDDLKIETVGSNIGAYKFDGTDFDDDSWYFNMNIDVTNKRQNDHLIIDRESLFIDLVDESRQVIEPAREFNYKTGHRITTSDYGYDKNDHKVLVVLPGQTARLILYNAYQVPAPGGYRGLLQSMRYTFDDVTYNEDTDQFERRGRVYELPRIGMEEIEIDRDTIMVDSQFIDNEVGDNKYNLHTFRDADLPFTFSYPQEFTLKTIGDSWTISFDDKPYIVLSEDEVLLPDRREETASQTTALNAARTLKTTWAFNEDSLSGTITRYKSLNDDFEILLYEYSDTSETFDRYKVGEVFVETFVLEE